MSESGLTIEITGTNYELNDRERKYIDDKCRKLANHMSAHSHKSAFVSAKITRIGQPGEDKYQCAMVVTLPDKTLNASEVAETPTAAADITEEKMQRQILKYKTERRNDGVNRGGIMARIKASLRRK